MFNDWLTCGLLLKNNTAFLWAAWFERSVWQCLTTFFKFWSHVWTCLRLAVRVMFWHVLAFVRLFSVVFGWSAISQSTIFSQWMLYCNTRLLLTWCCSSALQNSLGLWIVMVRSDRDAADLSNSGAETVAVLTWVWVLTRGLWTISLLIKKFSSWLVRFFGGFTFERGRIPSWAHVWWLWGSSWMRCSTQKRPRQVEWYRTWHKAQKSNCTLIIIINNIYFYLSSLIYLFRCLFNLFIYLFMCLLFYLLFLNLFT